MGLGPAGGGGVGLGSKRANLLAAALRAWKYNFWSVACLAGASALGSSEALMSFSIFGSNDSISAFHSLSSGWDLEQNTNGWF